MQILIDIAAIDLECALGLRLAIAAATLQA